MAAYPEALKRLIEHLNNLPGIGPKTAERLAFHLITEQDATLQDFAAALTNLKTTISRCRECQNFTDSDLCSICRDSRRNHKIICVVARPQDMVAIDRMGDYDGVFHILGGILDPLDGITPDRLTIKELGQRIDRHNAQEIILALNPDMPGETTMLYLKKILADKPGLTITRLARGLPSGSDVEYADEVTLSSALKGRRQA